MAAELYRLGFAGHIAAWTVTQVGDTLCALPDGAAVEDTVTIQVAGLAEWARGRAVSLGWGQFDDDAEVIYVYDKADEGFGYGFNVSAPQCSEWGYAPFARTSEAA